MKHTSFSDFCLNNKINLTPLRQEILEILYTSHQPLGAYEVLNKLRKKRPKAEPPTVYRVLDFLVQENLLHRIESQNTYVACAHLSESKSTHIAVLMTCKKCKKSFEFEDKTIFRHLKKIEKEQNFIIDSIIEMQGTCAKCVEK